MELKGKRRNVISVSRRGWQLIIRDEQRGSREMTFEWKSEKEVGERRKLQS